MKKSTDNSYILSTGKSVYASGGIIGLCPGDDAITDGYDGHITYNLMSVEYDDEATARYTKEEIIEIADFMIKGWKDYRDKVLKNEKET